VTISLEDKKNVVAEVHKVAKEATSGLVADYRGLTVAEMTELRVKAREIGLYLHVVRNTLAKRALKDTAFDCLKDSCAGPSIFAFSTSEPRDMARLLRDFSKGHENVKVKALSILGKLLPASELSRVADLPNREQALSMLLGVMKAPISKFVRTLAEPYAQVARISARISEQKQSA
jgi:large subunit ribosomal protein L10